MCVCVRSYLLRSAPAWPPELPAAWLACWRAALDPRLTALAPSAGRPGDWDTWLSATHCLLTVSPPWHVSPNPSAVATTPHLLHVRRDIATLTSAWLPAALTQLRLAALQQPHQRRVFETVVAKLLRPMLLWRAWLTHQPAPDAPRTPPLQPSTSPCPGQAAMDACLEATLFHADHFNDVGQNWLPLEAAVEALVQGTHVWQRPLPLSLPLHLSIIYIITHIASHPRLPLCYALRV